MRVRKWSRMWQPPGTASRRLLDLNCQPAEAVPRTGGFQDHPVGAPPLPGATRLRCRTSPRIHRTLPRQDRQSQNSFQVCQDVFGPGAATVRDLGYSQARMFPDLAVRRRMKLELRPPPAQAVRTRTTCVGNGPTLRGPDPL